MAGGNPDPVSFPAWRKIALGGGGFGAGVVIALAAIRAAIEKPELLGQVLQGPVLSFAALVIGMVVFRDELRNFNELHGRNVAATEKLAESVTVLSHKDDQRAREQDLVLDHLACNSEAVLLKQHEILAMLPNLKCQSAL